MGYETQVLGGATHCIDNGGGSPCVLSGNCNQTLTATVATVRPDGVMTLAVGLSQLLASTSWLQAKRPFSVALFDLFPASMIRHETSMKRMDAPIQLFSGMFATAPNAGLASSGPCEGYSVGRSYAEERTTILRRESATFTI